MSKYIGRRVSLGIARETTRGTYVAPAYWLPHTALDFDDRAEKITDGAVRGVIDDASQTTIASLFSQGSIEGEVRDRSFGLLLYAMLGSVSSALTDVTAYTHTFSLAQSNQHTALSLTVIDPDGQIFFRRAMLNELTITYELGGYISFAAEFMAHASDDTSGHTASYIVENKFAARMANLKLAATVGALDAASATSIKSAKITIRKNLVKDDVLGTIEPEDILNQQFAVEGEFTLNYTDQTIKDFMTANTYRALRLECINTDAVLTGSSSYPTFQLNLPRAHFFDWESDYAIDRIRTQTVQFKGLYDLANSLNVISSAVLINLATGY